VSRWAQAFREFLAVEAIDTVNTVDSVADGGTSRCHIVNCVNSVMPPAARCERAVSTPNAGGAPWHDGVARMGTMPPPLGFTPLRWRRACLDAAGLIEAHGAELLALGWTATDTFGLHATAPGGAVDCYELAMLLDGGTLAELTGGEAGIMRPSGAVLRVRRGAGRPVVPAWKLDGKELAHPARDGPDALPPTPPAHQQSVM